MWRRDIVASAVAALAFAQTFTFTIGSPVAHMTGHRKVAPCAIRSEGWAARATEHGDGCGGGLMRGARKSLALKLVAMSTPGVYAVYPTWPAEGDWVVSLRGTCASASAGALIPIGPGGFIRASSKFFPRPATAPELDAALQALSEGRKK